MPLKTLFVFSFLLFWQFTIANPVDSVFTYIETLPLTNQLNAIDQLSFEFVTENSRQVIPFLQEYEQLAVKKNEPRHLAQIYLHLSLAYYYLGKYDDNLNYSLKAIHLFDSLGNRSKLGTMYGETGYQMKRRNLPRAFQLMQKGVDVLESIDDREALAKIYDNYGVLHEMNNQFDSALFFYRKALSIKEKRNDSLGVPYSLNNIFSLFMLMENSDSALYYLNRSTQMRLKINDMIGLSENYSYLGQYYAMQNDPASSIIWNQKALKIAREHHYTYLIQSLYRELSDSYEKQNDLSKALAYHKLYKQFQDSLINVETNKTIANLQIQFETAEKEKELMAKEQRLVHEKSLRTLIIIIAIITLVSIAGFFIIRIQINLRNEKIKVRNALIEGEQTERNRLALELHDGVANDLNAVILFLNNHEDAYMIDPGLIKLKQIHQSVRQLSHTLMPRSLKENGLLVALNELKINYSSALPDINLQLRNMENRVHPVIEFNVYRIVQEALNNIVKHANASSVLIDGHVIHQKLIMSIEDNGVGFSSGHINQNGIGLQNIENRVKMMNGQVHYRSAPGEGTSIEIEIPIK